MQEDNHIRIERITEIAPFLECIPFETKIRKKKRDIVRVSNMMLILKDVMSSPICGCWIAYDGEKVVGYTIAFICNTPVQKHVSLYRIVAPDEDVKERLKETLIEFGKANKIRPGVFRVETFANEKALENMGWNKVSTIMEKRFY